MMCSYNLFLVLCFIFKGTASFCIFDLVYKILMRAGVIGVMADWITENEEGIAIKPRVAVKWCLNLVKSSFEKQNQFSR